MITGTVSLHASAIQEVIAVPLMQNHSYFLISIKFDCKQGRTTCLGFFGLVQ